MFTSRQQSVLDPRLCAQAVREAVRHNSKDLLGMIALAEIGDRSVSGILRDIEESHQEKSPYEGAMGEDAFRNETVNITMNMIEIDILYSTGIVQRLKGFHRSGEMRM